MALLSPELLRTLNLMNVHPSGLRVVADRYELLKLFEGRAFERSCEIGVQDGHYSWFILRDLATREHHMVDPWLLQDPAVYPEGREPQEAHDNHYQGVLTLFKAEIEAGRAVIHREYSASALPALKGGLDWAYIDGNHTLAAVREDLRLCAEAVRPGGFICGHDLCEHEGYGVIQAVAEFCCCAEWRLWAAAAEGCWGSKGTPSYVLRRNKEE